MDSVKVSIKFNPKAHFNPLLIGNETYLVTILVSYKNKEGNQKKTLGK